MKKVVILIDGQNLYYSLHGMGIVEKKVDWTKLFHDLLDDGDELIRSYWFRPAKIQDNFYTEANIKNQIIYKKYRNHMNTYRNNPSEVPEKIGDFDYAEAIRFVKENMTKISVVKIHKGIPPKSLSMSRDLSVLADKVINVYETDLKSTYKMP